MNEERFWIGLDLGEASCSLCIVNDAGEPVREGRCDSEVAALETALADVPRQAIGLVAVEAGATTHLVRQLRSRGYPVGIFEARKASKFLAIRRSKTDASDARGLADLARLGRHTVTQVHLKSVELEHVRSELAMRQRLVRVRVAIEASIRSRLVLHGRRMKPIFSSGGVRRNVDAEIDAILSQDGIDLAPHLEPLVALAESLRAYLRVLDSSMERAAKAHPVCKLLMEAPGVGPLLALSFYSAIEDPSRFRRASDVGAYLGLVPRRYQSGDVTRTRGITKTGNTLTRTLLVIAARVMRGHKLECELGEWGNKLRERLGPKRSDVAVARKLAVVLLTMWKTGVHFEAYPRGRASVA